VFERLYYYLQLEEGGPGLTWRRHSIRWVGFPPPLTAPRGFVVPRFWLEIIPGHTSERRKKGLELSNLASCPAGRLQDCKALGGD